MSTLPSDIAGAARDTVVKDAKQAHQKIIVEEPNMQQHHITLVQEGTEVCVTVK